MKAQAAALSHKSDAGGVILNLADEAAVRAAWTQIHANVAAYDDTITLDGVLIETMGARALEMIVGAKNDPDWGPVVLAGFGGVTAEILKDVALITPDLDETQIIATLMGLKTRPCWLDGAAPGAGCARPCRADPQGCRAAGRPSAPA
jgi:hypothetical protein